MQDATAPDPIRCISAAAPHCHRDLRRRFGLRNLRRTSYVYVCMCLLINDSTYAYIRGEASTKVKVVHR
jgi:hypothetical protein